MSSDIKIPEISQKHLLGIQDLSVSDVTTILNEASKFIELNKSKNKNEKFKYLNYHTYSKKNGSIFR